MRELDKAQILKPVGLGGGDRENDCAGQGRVAVPENRDRPLKALILGAMGIGRGGEGGLGRQMQVAGIGNDPLAEGDGADMSFADGA